MTRGRLRTSIASDWTGQPPHGGWTWTARYKVAGPVKVDVNRFDRGIPLVGRPGNFSVAAFQNGGTLLVTLLKNERRTKEIDRRGRVKFSIRIWRHPLLLRCLSVAIIVGTSDCEIYNPENHARDRCPLDSRIVDEKHRPDHRNPEVDRGCWWRWFSMMRARRQ